MNRIKIFHAGEKSYLCLNGELLGGVLSYEIRHPTADRAEVAVVLDAEEVVDCVNVVSDMQAEARAEKYRNEMIEAITSRRLAQDRADFWWKACALLLALLGGILGVTLLVAIAALR